MFVVKLTIAIFIIIICTVLGTRKSKRYETREHMLRELVATFSGLQSEIKYMLTCIPDAIERLRQNMNTNLKYVLGSISVDMLSEKYDNDLEINRKIYENIYAVNELKNYDKEILYNGLINLGKGDIDTQVGIIQGTIATLESQISEAVIDRQKNSKMYRTLGAAVGLVIAIVFI